MSNGVRFIYEDAIALSANINDILLHGYFSDQARQLAMFTPEELNDPQLFEKVMLEQHSVAYSRAFMSARQLRKIVGTKNPVDFKKDFNDDKFLSEISVEYNQRQKGTIKSTRRCRVTELDTDGNERSRGVTLSYAYKIWARNIVARYWSNPEPIRQRLQVEYVQLKGAFEVSSDEKARLAKLAMSAIQDLGVENLLRAKGINIIFNNPTYLSCSSRTQLGFCKVYESTIVIMSRYKVYPNPNELLTDDKIIEIIKEELRHYLDLAIVKDSRSRSAYEDAVYDDLTAETLKLLPGLETYRVREWPDELVPKILKYRDDLVVSGKSKEKANAECAKQFPKSYPHIQQFERRVFEAEQLAIKSQQVSEYTQTEVQQFNAVAPFSAKAAIITLKS